MGLDFTNVWPYNAMKEVDVDGQKMVRIPRIYVRNTKLPNTSKYAGKYQYSIAQEKIDGDWHVHPAFMDHGTAASYLDLSCYEASHDAKDSSKPASVSTASFWQNVNRQTAIDTAQKRNVTGGTPDKTGWHCWDIYCQALLARLMLIEMGTTDIAFPESGSPDYVYHGIHQPFGNPQSPTWLPGISNMNDRIYLANNYGNGALVDTGVKAAGNGWPTGFSMTTGTSFDLGDVFIADAVTGTENDGTCSDYQYLARNGVNEAGYFTGYRGGYTNAHGMFAISQETCGSRSGYGSPSAVWGAYDYGHGRYGPLRFRLAHFVA